MRSSRCNFAQLLVFLMSTATNASAMKTGLEKGRNIYYYYVTDKGSTVLTPEKGTKWWEHIAVAPTPENSTVPEEAAVAMEADTNSEEPEAKRQCTTKKCAAEIVNECFWEQTSAKKLFLKDPEEAGIFVEDVIFERINKLKRAYATSQSWRELVAGGDEHDSMSEFQIFVIRRYLYGLL